MPQSNERTSVSAVIWRFRDGRAGHENQVVGLSEAIARNLLAVNVVENREPQGASRGSLPVFFEPTSAVDTLPLTNSRARSSVQFCDIYLNRSLRGLKSLLPHRLSFATSLPAPDLLIGAGHSTHLPLLTFQQRFGGKTIVIMKPSLPTALFDLCLIPTHDNLMFQPHNVVRTEGSLNRIQPSEQQDSRRGIFLIGGPSRHFAWSDENVISQILSIMQKERLQWMLATSERTPESFVRAWRTKFPQTPLVTSQECSSQWLPEQLAMCSTTWVTCDSMSMIYEALTSGTRVGLLGLPQIHRDRISRNVQRLVAAGLTVTTRQWLADRKLPIQNRPFSESNRCAAIIAERLFQPAVSENVFHPSTNPLKESSTIADFRSPPGELNDRFAPQSVHS